MLNLTNFIVKREKYSDLDDFFEDGITETEIDISKLCEALIQNPPKEQIYTVYIPSKGRPKTGSTYKLCSEYKIPFKIIVEPQDFDDYASEIGSEHLIQMPENNKGIQYARTFIKEYSKNNNETHHWQMDDDMKYFTSRQNNKNVKTNIYSVIAIVEYITGLFNNISISGITSNAFAFSKPKLVQENRLAYGVVLVNNDTPLTWREYTVEDWDYTLNSLEAGYCTLAFNHINFVTPQTGTNAGGNQLTDWETTEKRKLFYEHFSSLWPDYFECREMSKNNAKGYKLHHKCRFFQNYKQKLQIKKSVLEKL